MGANSFRREPFQSVSNARMKLSFRASSPFQGSFKIVVHSGSWGTASFFAWVFASHVVGLPFLVEPNPVEPPAQPNPFEPPEKAAPDFRNGRTRSIRNWYEGFFFLASRSIIANTLLLI